MNISAKHHFRAYVPAPITKEQIEHVEILFGGLHWRAERVLQAVFENVGYKARPLPPATRDDLLRGRELADIGQCCPTSFTTGNLANFLQAEADRMGASEVSDRYIRLFRDFCGWSGFWSFDESPRCCAVG